MSKTILVTGARAPVALHLARLFHGAGHRVVLADSFRLPMARATRFKHGYERLPSPRVNFPRYATAVGELVRRRAVDLVIPTCEEVFYLAAARDVRNIDIPLFAPSFDLLARAHNKATFATLATGLGADPPRTILLECAGALRDLPAPADTLVFKPAWSRFGSRVLVRPDATRLATVSPSAADPWVAQDYLPGDEISACAIAAGGALAAFQAYRPTYRVGSGAGVAFEPVDNPVAREFAGGLAARLAWTGQISFDFRHDAEGALRVIECNPRATSGLHFFEAGDGLVEAILNGAPATASGQAPMTLPLAMLAYGLPHALRHRGLRRWLLDFRGMRDISAWPGDRGMFAPQLLALGEIIIRAARRRTGLVEAAVRDIEWDGEPLS